MSHAYIPCGLPTVDSPTTQSRESRRESWEACPRSPGQEVALSSGDLPVQLSNITLPYSLRGREVGEGMLRVPEEFLGTREDRSWGICHSPGPTRAAQKGSRGAEGALLLE